MRIEEESVQNFGEDKGISSTLVAVFYLLSYVFYVV